MWKYMRHFIFALIFLVPFSMNAQDISAYKAEDLMKRLNSNKDTLYVVNFWATWCGPCIKEMPEFEKISAKYKGKPVKVLLVSLDFDSDYPEKIQKFINKKHLPHEVVWLNETKANEFIPKINSQWQGSLPATMLYYKKKEYKKLFEGVVKAPQVTLLVDEKIYSDY